MIKKPYEKGEVISNAQRLLKAKGDDALVYARHIVQRKQENDDELELAFWERIATQIELLISEPPPV